RYAEMRQGYELAIDAITHTGNHKAQHAEFERMWGRACLEQSDFVEAHEHFDGSLNIYRHLGDEGRAANVMLLLGRLARDRNEHEESDQWLQDAEILLRKHDDALGLAQIAHSRAWLLHHAGDSDRAEQLALHALAEHERLDKEKEIVPTLQLLTIIKRWVRRDTVAARAYGERALQLAGKLQDRNAAAISLVHLSAICYSEGRAGEGQQLAELAAADLERMGDRKARGVALYWLSVNLEKLEAFEKALQHGFEALALFQALPSHYDEVMTMLHLGDLLVALHRSDEAEQIWKDALELGLEHNRSAVPELRARLDQIAGRK
ncbi:MAG: tetratricopeptide repeat protein, partial [Caldilinea sp.]|nr:tetratricopeptide repeat protein [Caldilinea sp.]